MRLHRSPQALHFVEILVGPKCTELTVERPQQYYFDRERCWAGMIFAGDPARWL